MAGCVATDPAQVFILFQVPPAFQNCMFLEGTFCKVEQAT